jgi:hypothetical protein
MGSSSVSSALATLVNLSQDPSTFEIADAGHGTFASQQHPRNLLLSGHRATNVALGRTSAALFCSVFLVIFTLGKSHLGSDSKENWRLASDGCAHSSTDYSIINPVPYPPWTVVIFAIGGTITF